MGARLLLLCSCNKGRPIYLLVSAEQLCYDQEKHNGVQNRRRRLFAAEGKRLIRAVTAQADNEKVARSVSPEDRQGEADSHVAAQDD